MPSLVLHKFLPTTNGKTLVQLNSEFQQYQDGYITVPIRYLVTPLGIALKVVKSLAPKPLNKLPPNSYIIRDLPENKGLFINETSVVYENGMHFVDLKCSTCTRQQQFHITIDKETKAISSSYTEFNEETGEQEFEYFSFTITTPVVYVKTSHLSNEDCTPPPDGILSARGDYAVVNTESIRFNERLKETNIINRSAWIKGRSQHEWKTVVDRESFNDGSVSRTSYRFYLDYVKGTSL